MNSMSIPVLILAEILGTHSDIFTISKVPVQIGSSISIPCLYDQEYTNHVKYLCRGYSGFSCSEIVNTKQSHHTGRASISDDAYERLLNVTFYGITKDDTYYWCAVKKNGFDAKNHFELVPTTGVSSLYVDRQQYTAFERGSVFVVCHCENAMAGKWCKLGSVCVTGQSGFIDGAAVTLHHNVPKVFNVTMSNLSAKSSGWYWCAVGGVQMPIHLTVKKQEFLASTTMFPTSTRDFSNSQPSSSYSTWVTKSTSAGENTKSLQDHKSSSLVTVLIVVLILLLLVTLTGVFGWKIVRSHKTTPEEPIAAASQTGDDENIMYATVRHYRNPATELKDQEHNEGTVYCNIAFQDGAN
ncbi:polymeric immunoglobulin receptor-like [Aulostomus maculatus]